MIKKDTFADLLNALDFIQDGEIYTKNINGHEMKVDFANQKLIYPQGVTTIRKTTLNFSQNENFVVFECIHNLLQSGYKPEHITLEPEMTGGRESTSFYCDILLKDNNGAEYLLIECKTTDNKDSEFEKAWKRMQKDGGQLFNYFNSYRKAQYLCLYTADFSEGKIEQSYHLVSMKDNEKYLESDDKLRSYQSVRDESGSKSDFFQVWKQTYQLDSTEHNLFESAPFDIGTRPFSINDLKELDNNGIQKKYHQFATIMRQHNVSGRENAFDKLVNLFLAKIKDESENPNALKVYWRGAAQDNYFDLQDRLQELYKKGMDEFLDEEITHITNDEIEDAFVLFKNKTDETKKTILEKFKQIKYYTSNDFAFLDVHNHTLFFKNGAILKEVVQMLQDIRLKTDNSGENQFLGDLFEGFLDQGVKQSEGQFFTPLPIVRFLVSSLPLEHIISNSESVPQMIDYACGAGHFLNEYAKQIRPFIQKYKNTDTAPYYQAIYGIEKEYRLSKVAKVSAFMYGQDGINIIYGDGLTEHDDIKKGTFSVLVANPPYSVKGFLETLSEEERNAFALYQSVDKTDTFNSIETFFIERAAQLLTPGGVAAIILPSSVLSNGGIYIKTREILLQHFDIVAIAEFGSGTFGKTNTNTATLFLRRKADTPNLSIHYKNRVNYWFNNDHSTDSLFEDGHLLAQYCQDCDIDETDYHAFIFNKRLPENGIFADYRAEYQKSNDWKAHQKMRAFQRKSADEQQQEFEIAAFKFASDIERDKLHYYLLASANPQPVLLIKSPANNKAAKTFLGYEWSTRKGNEGIKYIGSTEIGDEDNPNRNQGIFKINTPLFNPNDLSDTGKINHLICQNFQTASNNFPTTIPEKLRPYASLNLLNKMLDFSRISFDKAIQTSLTEKVEIISKYPLIRLKDLASIIRGVTYSKNEQAQKITNKIILPADNITLDGHLNISKEIYLDENKELDDEKRLKKDDIFICFSSGSEKHVGKLCLITQDTNYFAGGFMGILRSNKEVLASYLFNVLNLDNMRNKVRQLSNGNNIKNLSSSIGELKVPLPPKNIQEQIVIECQKIDQEYETSRMEIETYRTKIAKIFSDLEVLAETQSDKTRGGG
ncbi:N-6 DNA methylase [Neisseria zalophi]|uniref:DNA methyltransferase n=1 Tax=Neisseria zalophi TaxID=640030 RepID=A0A5J6Q189_9NEIS|nr:N-6 DNA methylase [Neisseria zalophi]QEY26710.1 DNA methyltransferase [Neisseria zalophi]